MSHTHEEMRHYSDGDSIAVIDCDKPECAPPVKMSAASGNIGDDWKAAASQTGTPAHDIAKIVSDGLARAAAAEDAAISYPAKCHHKNRKIVVSIEFTVPVEVTRAQVAAFVDDALLEAGEEDREDGSLGTEHWAMGEVRTRRG